MAYKLNPKIDLTVDPSKVSLHRTLELLGVSKDAGGLSGDSWWRRVKGKGPSIETAKGTDALKMMESLVSVGSDGKVYLADSELAEALRKVLTSGQGSARLTSEGRKIQNYLAQVIASSQDFGQVAAEGHAMLTSKFIKHRAEVGDVMENVASVMKTSHDAASGNWLSGKDADVKKAIDNFIAAFEKSGGEEIIVGGSGSDATFKLREYLKKELKIDFSSGKVDKLGDLTGGTDALIEKMRRAADHARGKLEKAQIHHLEMFDRDLVPALSGLAEKTRPLAEQLAAEVEKATGVKLPEVYLNGAKNATRLMESQGSKAADAAADKIAESGTKAVEEGAEKGAETLMQWAGKRPILATAVTLGAAYAGYKVLTGMFGSSQSASDPQYSMGA